MCNDNGWIKLHRKIRKSVEWIGLTPLQRLVLVDLLLNVEWTEQEWMCRKCKLIKKLQPGQTAKSIRQLAKDAKIGRGVYRRGITNLKATGFLIAEKNENNRRCHTIHSIKNWERFQALSTKHDLKTTQEQPSDDPQTTLRQPSDDPVSLYKKVKKVKKERIIPQANFSDQVKELSNLLREKIISYKPTHKLNSYTNWEDSSLCDTWCKDMDLLVRVDKRNPDAIRSVIIWAFTDEFWRGVIQSPSGLRKNFDKVETAKMGKKPIPKKEHIPRRWADELD